MVSADEVVLCCTEQNSKGGDVELRRRKSKSSACQRWYQLATTLNIWHSQLDASFNFIFPPQIATFVAEVKGFDW